MTRNICIVMPEELLAEVDEMAKCKYMSRSEYIRYVLHKDIIKEQARDPHAPKYKKTGKEPWLFDMDDS